MVLWIILQRCTFLKHCNFDSVCTWILYINLQLWINSFAHLLGFALFLSCNTCIHVKPVHIITCSILNTVNLQLLFLHARHLRFARKIPVANKSWNISGVLFSRYNVIHILIAKISCSVPIFFFVNHEVKLSWIKVGLQYDNVLDSSIVFRKIIEQLTHLPSDNGTT